MSEPRRLRCYDYVDRPFAGVRELLRLRGPDLFRRATTSAATRARDVGASLHARVGTFDVAVDVRMHVHAMVDEDSVAGLPPVTRITLSWEAAQAAAFFPVMKAELSMWPLTSNETELELEGAYQPPLGAVGSAVDTVIGHRIADATVHRFLADLVAQLRRELL
ncbi:MAG: hypothetical protein ACRELB_09525 [Polyangiaceae bacterium]